MEPPPASDAAIRATNDEAFAAKVSASHRGYLSDPFIVPLYRALAPDLPGAPPSRQPMINRGTYARVSFVRRCVASLLAAAPPGSVPQVVSLGAGFDTLPFVLLSPAAAGAAPAAAHPLRVVELDFADVVAPKANAVSSSPRLAQLFESMTRTEQGGMTASARAPGGEYVLAACDLRDVHAVRRCLQDAGLDFSAPTVFVSECVLVYMRPEPADALIRLAQSEFKGLRAFVNYEPIEPRDPFGRQMVANVSLRGSPLLGIFEYPSVASQKLRYEKLGWNAVDSMSMLDAFATMDKEDVARINGIEMLDEIEEWQLLMKHYCFLWARSAPPGDCPLLEKLVL